MRWHEPHLVSGAYPGRRHRPPLASPAGSGVGIGTSAGKGTGRTPNPAGSRLVNPASVVVRQPSPGLRTDEHPAARAGVKEPVPETEGIPSEGNAIRTPAVSIS